MGIIGGIIIICFIIGLFNAMSRIIFGIGWCAWQLIKVLGVIFGIAVILSIIGNCIK